MKRYSIFLVFFLFFTCINIYAQENLEQYFSQEIASSEYPFKVISAKEKIRYFGIGKTKLYLKHYTVKKLLNYSNIYKLIFEFKSKKKFFKIHNKETLILFYNGNIISFKTVKGKKTFKLNNEEKIILKKTNKGYYVIKRVPKQYNFKIPIQNGKLYLTIEFY